MCKSDMFSHVFGCKSDYRFGGIYFFFFIFYDFLDNVMAKMPQQSFCSDCCFAMFASTLVRCDSKMVEMTVALSSSSRTLILANDSRSSWLRSIPPVVHPVVG